MDSLSRTINPKGKIYKPTRGSLNSLSRTRDSPRDSPTSLKHKTSRVKDNLNSLRAIQDSLKYGQSSSLENSSNNLVRGKPLSSRERLNKANLRRDRSANSTS